jgi:GTP-binding protein HflX
MALSGKDVLIEDRLFSTLETTVGRMLSSPRVLMADTIGFIDRIPAELLDAFRATLAESLECDLLLLVLDASDTLSEIERKLKTSRRDLLERMDDNDRPITGVVLSKIDLLKEDIGDIYHLVEENCLEVIAEVSAIAEQGLDQLCQCILDELIGPPLRFHLRHQTEKDSTPIERLLHDLHECGQMDSQIDNGEQGFEIEMRIPKLDLDRLRSRHPTRIKMQ